METKITILGDIMCEPLLLKASKHGNSYNFDRVFDNIRGMLEGSDYVIGNLETPMAGAEAGYVRKLFSFNAPDEFADAIKRAGIDMVLTANNHCLDRGIDGLIRTTEVLDTKGIPYAGTCNPAGKRREATYFNVNGIWCAVIAYTYGTNYFANRILLDEEQQKLVNTLRPQQELYYIPKKGIKASIPKRAVNKILRGIPEEQRYYVKKALGMTVNVPHADDSLNEDTISAYLNQLEEDIKEAKEHADFVLFCPHMGGQFNSEPGAFSQYVMEKAVQMGCDAVCASHAHVVLRHEIIGKTPCFYSLGNLTMSPNSVYLLHENLPEYGIAVHMYLRDKELSRVTFSILKIVEPRWESLSVWPVDAYALKLKSEREKERLYHDVKQIYKKISGRDNVNPILQKEYELNYIS